MKSKYMWIDPDSGWKYGFPMVVGDEEHERMLLDAFCPKDCHPYVRYWPATRYEFIEDCNRQIELISKLESGNCESN